MLYSEFVSYAKQFIEISDSINDGWYLKTYKDQVYLVKSLVQFLEKPDDERNDLNELENSTLETQPDEQCINDPPINFRKWEYHIIHSISYQVPVLYFNVSNPNGQLLTLEELWKTIHPNFQESIFKNKWFTLSQQEHPFLFKPFFYFHPCHTEDFLNCFFAPQCNLLVTWLSSIGQVIWLNLSPVYGKRLTSI